MPDITAWGRRLRQAVGSLPLGMRASLIHLMPEEHGQNGLRATKGGFLVRATWSLRRTNPQSVHGLNNFLALHTGWALHLS